MTFFAECIGPRGLYSWFRDCAVSSARVCVLGDGGRRGCEDAFGWRLPRTVSAAARLGWVGRAPLVQQMLHQQERCFEREMPPGVRVLSPALSLSQPCARVSFGIRRRADVLCESMLGASDQGGKKISKTGRVPERKHCHRKATFFPSRPSFSLVFSDA